MAGYLDYYTACTVAGRDAHDDGTRVEVRVTVNGTTAAGRQRRLVRPDITFLHRNGRSPMAN